MPEKVAAIVNTIIASAACNFAIVPCTHNCMDLNDYWLSAHLSILNRAPMGTNVVDYGNKKKIIGTFLRT